MHNLSASSLSNTSVDENKAGLAHCLIHYMMEHGKHLPDGCELVVGGGCHDNKCAKSTVRDVLHLNKEADTRIIVHA